MSGKTTLWSTTIGDVTLPITPTSIDAMVIGATTPAAAGVTDLTQNGKAVEVPQLVTAAGSNSQSGAAPIVKSLAIMTLVSASSRAGRLPTNPTVGQQQRVMNDTAVNAKVYPGTNATIGAASTNSAAVLPARKASLYVAVTANHWAVDAGA